ncbi:unnamed protein product [Rotaria magnacalcarata]|uniref:Cyclin-like domain-containing protein n=2 Tax=Rotaria magnacalcarata TaxID=392030 RepID=A0A817A1C7_9BILA|nr:unnamed protein product [Rotaria magnacalcarata]CAF1388340.1 unnamed protein product [Rotaria magnacalcarata]CAF2103485.1 unnamed protein product [Rotaria magnacalcarata]CAF2124455.1 unnamed protein product [Rotaria magnacalcarata]CAF2248829.1 unnamed protein product [Rotaria magnacalcarata]
MSSKTCKCGGTEIDTDPVRGIVCMQCGDVIEDMTIAGDVEIIETNGGGRQVVGQYVSNHESYSTSGGGMMNHTIRESRQITLYKARRGITDIASNMRMNHQCIDRAFNIYKMALDQGLSRGNKSSHLLASCLYIICRTEGTQHILLDFCDHVDADISVLARIYLRIAHALHLNVPHTDPSLLIPRYAAKLDFGDRTNAVSNTALRIVQRMKRDWLNIGRRSSGLCGSALLFAARMHNFNRTIQQIVDVVKISKATIIRRLQEFETTPTAQLNMKEFNTIELEEEQDPPAFSKAKRMTKLAQYEESFNIEQIEREIIDTQKEIDEQLEKLSKPRGQLAKYAKYVDLEKNILGAEEDELIQKVLTNKTAKRKHSTDGDEDILSTMTTTEKESAPIDENDMKWAANYIEEQQTQLILSLFDDNAGKPAVNNDDDNEEQDEEDDFKSLRPSLQTMGIEPVTASLNYPKDNLNATTSNVHHQHQVVLDLPEWRPTIDLSNDELDLTGIDDNEIDDMILTRDETKLKLKSWLRENKDWFLEEKRRQRNKEAAEQKKNGSSSMTAAQRRKRKKKAAAAAASELNKLANTATSHHQLAGFNSLTPAGLAAAAHLAIEAEKNSQDKRLSSKINYDVLKKLTMKKDGTGQTPSSPAMTNTNEAERTT